MVSSITMAKTNYSYASDRMKERNPMRFDDARTKMQATLKSIGHKPKIQGGNGRGLTDCQSELLKLLEPHGYKPELIVRVGMGKGNGYPTHYKIDIGNAQKKVAIEIDGRSHRARIRKQQDDKKEAFLFEQGWTVIRIPNEAVNSIETFNVVRLCSH
jgi:hypothetical protein